MGSCVGFIGLCLRIAADLCVRLPPALNYENGALLEPLAVAVHAVRRAAIQPGQNCLIFGAGAVGLLCAAAATHAGCGTVTIADIDEGRLAFARANGFADLTYTVKPRRGANADESLSIAREVASNINSLSSPSLSKLERPKYVFECTGAEACVQASIYVSLDTFLCTNQDSLTAYSQLAQVEKSY